MIHTREHLLIHQVRQLRPTTLLALLERLQALRASPVFAAICQASYCDARGRLGLEDCEYPQVAYLQAAASSTPAASAGSARR